KVLVVTDLPKEVGQAVIGAEIAGKGAQVGCAFPLRVLPDEQGVLMLGMVFEVSIQPVGPRRAHRVEEPGELVVRKGQELRHQTMAHPRPLWTSRGEFLEDQQMPLLVVLLPSADSDTLEDSPSEVRLAC